MSRRRRNLAYLPELVTGLDRLYHHANEPFSKEAFLRKLQTSSLGWVYERYLQRFSDTSGNFVLQHAVFENFPQFNDFSFNTLSSSTFLIDRGMEDNRPYLQFPQDLATNCHTFLLKAMQGSGKTFAFAEFVRQHRTEFPTVLIVTPRQCVALQMVKALNEHGVPCCMYQDHKTMKHGCVNVCQLDSLPRFSFCDYQALKMELGSTLLPLSGDEVLDAYNAFSDFHVSTLMPCDVIAMDEAEAVIEHLCSPTLMSQGMLPRDILVGYIKRCKLVLAMQADLNDNVWDFLWSLRNKQDVLTGHDPGFRMYWRIAAPSRVKDFERVWSLERFVNLIRCDVMDRNKKIVILSDSKKELEVYIAKFTTDWGVPLSDCLVYKADSTRAIKRTMAYCNDTWVECKYLFYSPTVSFGVDFNPDIPHFNAVYCHFNGNTVTGTVAFQMINRCRQLIDNKVFFYTSSRRPKTEYLDIIARNGPCIDPAQALIDLISDRILADSAYRSFVTPLNDLSEGMTRFDLVVAHAACRRAIYRGAVAVYEKQYRFLHELMNQITQFGSRLTHDTSRTGNPVTVHVVRRTPPEDNDNSNVDPPPCAEEDQQDVAHVSETQEDAQAEEYQPELELELPETEAEPAPDTGTPAAERPPSVVIPVVPHKKRRRELLHDTHVALAASICNAKDLTVSEYEQLQLESSAVNDDEQASLMRYKLFKSTGFDPANFAASLPLNEDATEREKEHVLHLMDVSGFTQCAGQCVYLDNMAKLLAFVDASPALIRQAAHVDTVVSIIGDQPVVAFNALLSAVGIQDCRSLFEGCTLKEQDCRDGEEAAGSRKGRSGEYGRSLKKWPVSNETWNAISECCAQTVFPAFAITGVEDWVVKGEQNYFFVFTLLNKTARRLIGGQGNVLDFKVTGRRSRKLDISFGDRARELRGLVDARNNRTEMQ